MAERESAPRRWWKTGRLVLWGAVLTLLVVFIIQNYETVPVQLIAWEVDIELAWVLLLIGALGFGLGWLLPRLRR